MSEGAPAKPWAGNATEYVAALVALAGRGRAWAPPSTSRTAMRPTSSTRANLTVCVGANDSASRTA